MFPSARRPADWAVRSVVSTSKVRFRRFGSNAPPPCRYPHLLILFLFPDFWYLCTSLPLQQQRSPYCRCPHLLLLSAHPVSDFCFQILCICFLISVIFFSEICLAAAATITPAQFVYFRLCLFQALFTSGWPERNYIFTQSANLKSKNLLPNFHSAWPKWKSEK